MNGSVSLTLSPAWRYLWAKSNLECRGRMSELTPDERQKIYEEEKVRLEAKEALAKAKMQKDSKNIGKGCFVVMLAGVAVFVVLSLLPPEKGSARKPTLSAQKLSAQNESEIQTALQSKGYPFPRSLEINETGWLVATFELSNPRSATYLENFATNTLLTIRNTMHPRSIASKYRVTLEGPPPGPGLILRYGSAMFIEGGKMAWEPARK